MIWKMKDGTLISIEDMENSHLLNCTRLTAERLLSISKNVSAAYSMSMWLDGEMALDQIDRDIRELELCQAEHEEVLDNLRREVKKRGLIELELRKEKENEIVQAHRQ